MSAAFSAVLPALDATPLIAVRNLDFRRSTRIIFPNIDLEVPRGKITAIMRPGSAGETMLLRLIGGQMRPDTDRIAVDGGCVHALCRRELYPLRKRMSMLFQSGALFTVKLGETGSGRSASKESRNLMTEISLASARLPLASRSMTSGG